MARRTDGLVLRSFRTLFEQGVIGELTDGQLLERFATAGADDGDGDSDGDGAAESAFAAIVERHGPMVLRICRNHLRDANDVEDAFQATFLVLVQKARALWVEGSLGPWIHRVARRIAIRARANAARRRDHERRAAESRPEQAEGPPARDDGLMALVHEEIDRLPERCRVPLILCDLEGLTHEQAARHLSWPVGTVKSRLMTGRSRLRARLVRRGAAPAALAVHAALAGSGSAGAGLAALAPTVPALVPTSLVQATIRAARLVAQHAGHPAAGTVPAAVALLMEGAYATMSFTKIKLGLLACGLVAGGAVVAAQQAHRDPLPSSRPSPSRSSAASVDEARWPRASSARSRAVYDDDPAVAREVARLDLDLLESEVELLKERVENALREMVKVESLGDQGNEHYGPEERERARASYEAARRAFLEKAAEGFRAKRMADGAEDAPADRDKPSAAAPAPGNPPPTASSRAPAAAVGSVDMDAVFKRYERVKRVEDQRRADVEDRRRQIARLEAQAGESFDLLKKLAPQSEDYRRQADRLTEIKTRIDGERQGMEREISARQSRDVASVLEDVRGVIAELAQKRGLDFVVKVSSDPRPDDNPMDVMAAAKRSVIYANPRNDITEEVIRELNRRDRAAAHGDRRR